jgi:hypothetical protein
MTAELPVISVMGELYAAFEEGGAGELAVRVQGKLPEGKLILVAASAPHSRYWYQSVDEQGGLLRAEMDSFSGAWAACGDREWQLSLGRITAEGVVLYTLRSKGSVDYVKELDEYFCDDRRRYAGAAGRFRREQTDYVVLPRYTDRKYFLSLLVTTAQARLASQISCHLEQCDWTEETLSVTIECPEGVEQPEGVSFHQLGSPLPQERLFPGRVVGEFSQSRQIRAEIPLAALSALTERQELVCALGREEERLLWCPVHVGRGELAVKLASAWEYYPLGWGVGGELYLSVDDRCRVVLERSLTLPWAKRLQCPNLEEFLEITELEGEGYVTGISEGGENWQWKLRLPGMDLTDMDEVQLCLEQQSGTRRLICSTQTQALEHGTLLLADISPLVEEMENSLMNDWFPVLALRQVDDFWYCRWWTPFTPCTALR